MTSEGRPRRVAVVTPYHAESRETLEANIASVCAQTYPVDHILVADGRPQPWLTSTSRRTHLTLPTACADCGDTPRSVGIAYACSRAFDAITLLDADCQLHPDAVATYLATAEREGVPLVIGRRQLVRPDGTPLDVFEEPNEPHVDTNCYFFLRPAFRALLAWTLIPPPFHVIDDRVVRRAVEAAHVRFAVTAQKTVIYPTRWVGHYAKAGEAAPAGAKDLRPALAVAFAKWRALSDEARHAYCAALGFDIPVAAPGAPPPPMSRPVR